MNLYLPKQQTPFILLSKGGKRGFVHFSDHEYVHVIL